MAKATPNKPLAVAVAGFLVLVVLAWTHRALTFPILLPEAAGDGAEAVLLPFLVGAMSDVWVAYLLSIVTAVVAWASGRTGAYVWLGLLAALSAAHQAYVEFFHFTIVPAHLAYLVDPDFLSANFSSALSVPGLVIIAAFAAMIALQHRLGLTASLAKGRRAAWAFGLLFPVCLLLHHENIMLRDRWFIPEPLKMQALENLLMRWKNYTPPARLSADEIAELAAAVGSEDLRPYALLSRPAISDDPTAVALRDAFAARRAAGKRPVIAVALMESMRPSETGYFAPALASLTPRLDALAARGLVFKRAYSTGSVTRGGQEAVLCGYLGSRDASLMRGSSFARIRCIPDELAAKSPRDGFFWYHGGEGRYDGQLRFWHAHKAQETLTLKDFDEAAARSTWGIGDVTFFRRAYDRLAAMRRSGAYDALAGMLLSMTNHIPWLLPADAPPEVAAQGRAAKHPSYVTTRYADYALGEFVDRAKKDGLWDDLILLVLSDHGNDVPPYAELYRDAATRDVQLQSHVNFLVVGGLVEDALRSQPLPAIDETVRSQADAAALMAFVYGLAMPVMGEVPGRAPRHLPVLSELEERVWLPEAGLALARADASAVGARPGEPGAVRKARLYYRFFREFTARR